MSTHRQGEARRFTSLGNTCCGSPATSSKARLRDDLFGSPSRIRWRLARDLAAHRLLFVDDSKRCPTIEVEWIRGDRGCPRVDTGLGAPSSATYLPGYAESRDPDAEVTTYAGTHVNNTADAMRLMWKTEQPIVFRDLAGRRRMSVASAC